MVDLLSLSNIKTFVSNINICKYLKGEIRMHQWRTSLVQAKVYTYTLNITSVLLRFSLSDL